MIMTVEQKYAAVLQELGEVLQHKNTTISCQRWKIEELETKLEAAEFERNQANELLQEADLLIKLLNEQIDELKGGAA